MNLPAPCVSECVTVLWWTVQGVSMTHHVRKNPQNCKYFQIYKDIFVCLTFKYKQRLLLFPQTGHNKNM